jgi:RNA polymerase sigma-70 factor, ECF subfamily
MTFFAPNTTEQKKDQTILQRIAAGDQLAIQDCLDNYSNLLWSLAKKFTRTAEDAEDAVQEIFIDLWQHAERFDPTKASEITFVALVARRRLIDRLRKLTRQPNFQAIDDVTISCPKSSEKQMHVALDATRVTRIINKFRPDQKQIINLAIYEGMTHSEIANVMGLPLGTVKTNIRRGFQKVRYSFGIRNQEFSTSVII